MPTTPLSKVRALYGELTVEDQLAILIDIIQGGPAAKALPCSDSFADALQPLDRALWASFQAQVAA